MSNQLPLQGSPEFDKMEIIKKGILSLSSVTTTDAGAASWNTNSVSTSANHGLGYVPIVVAYLNISGLTYLPTPYISQSGSGGTFGIEDVSIITTSTLITATATVTTYHEALTFGPATITYYLLRPTSTA